MQVSVITVTSEHLLVPAESNQQAQTFSKTERKFLSFFLKSTAIFTVLSVILAYQQMGPVIDGASLTWALVSCASVGAAVGMLFALANDVIINGRLEE